MPNSPRWNEGIYFRFNPQSVSREYKIPLEELVDFQVFLVTRDQVEVASKEWTVGNNRIYPLMYRDVNEIIKKQKYPLKENFWRTTPSLRIRGNSTSIEFPTVIAILNMTPDSFYPGSRVRDEDLEKRLNEIRKSDGEIVDIGGQSTRPGSVQVSSEEEMKRISRAVEISLNKNFTVSVDSYRPEIIKECLEMGVHLINDVSGMENSQIGYLAKRYDVPLVVMHKQGDFKTMQLGPHYDNTVNEIIDYFMEKISEARKIGIEDNLILDPGIGFGKRVGDNLSIINNLRDFKLGHPLLIGLSRKNFIGEIMKETVEERAISSLIFNAIALMNGADIIRVHDTEENLKLIKIMKKMREY
ncbi:MAG: dihydropteroate synthase [Candidatus Thermoplasmatota archaeon]|jgi:dihydropteroate synthase|nr:dihydropteroate synthase [Candidatus Thermoplasmatota archaeon]MCL6003177.1 dihydropteroate synthase [Candidatus Thermoplasmatota archaeon]